MALTIWLCTDLDFAMGYQDHSDYEREYLLEQDLEHEAHPDLEMRVARADVDPYAPELALEVVEPEVVDAAVWESWAA